jgi:hypothetical protein
VKKTHQNKRLELPFRFNRSRRGSKGINMPEYRACLIGQDGIWLDAKFVCCADQRRSTKTAGMIKVVRVAEACSSRTFCCQRGFGALRY